MCKTSKGVDVTWIILYQTLTHEDYSQFPFDGGQYENYMDIYLKVSQSYLHKEKSRPTILPCAEVVATLVCQANTSNECLGDIKGQSLARYQPEELNEKFYFASSEEHMHSH